MSPDQLAYLARGFVELGFWSGVAGAIAWKLVCDCWSVFTDRYLAWEERCMRIAHARARHVHGPLLLPGVSRAIPRAWIARVLRQRSAVSEARHPREQGDQWRACERLVDQHASARA